jgi:hypothetical protein
MAILVLFAGAWASMRRGRPVSSEHPRRTELEAERERLFRELAAIEDQDRQQTIDSGRYTERRRELVASLERVYAELDEEAAA